MAGRPVIELDRVGKRYRLGEHHGAGSDLRETLVRSARRVRGLPRPEVRELWSLRDVTLTVEEGSALGVVGANGAGKSTLLKVVSNITTPTEGTCRTRGRVGSLLEVGTGFHGELTGLENTYLNGAILGMTRREVRARLDEIVAFAGLERFMDTPVKRYSSGMFLRLGFAIAAHMEAEILLVDEVLAVGDADFQRRCLGKMGEVERSGRTVVFVSHNLDAMARLCPTAIWLDAGEVRTVGATEQVIADYMRSATSASAALALEPEGGRAAQVVGVSVVDDAGAVQSMLSTRDAAWLSVEVLVNDAVPGLDVAVQVATKHGVEILDEVMTDVGPSTIGQPGRYAVACRLPAILTPGEYVLGVWLGTAYEELEQLDEVLGFTVEGDDLGRPRRLVKLVPEWRITRLDDHLAGG
ncbi:MAG TPA: ABC transporter ATP-binding protein [Aquihabitans sp.]|jgi:ABC-2 type transport system ATP-binding protein/lipopolysaccharide transport system ATP-binding protein|nr:ABC transporter ATP-binding protein [Aquihabitans sp.]